MKKSVTIYSLMIWN